MNNKQNRTPYVYAEIMTLDCVAGQVKYSFEDNANLRNKKIIGIEALTVSDVSKTPADRTGISATVFLKSFLTLSSNGEEKISKAPLACFRPMSNYGSIKSLDLDDVNWAKSYVEIANATDNSASESFVFVVYYQDVR